MKMFSLNAKKIIVTVCLSIIALFFASCEVSEDKSEDKVVVSLGKYENRVFFTEGVFQDFTDYAKYYYTAAEVAENKYLEKIQETDFDTINTHLDDFEGWIKAHKESDPSREIVVNYDFDRAIIDTEDYIYIDSEEHTWDDGYTRLVRYNIYFFDTQTQVLYYFHNNI